MNGTAARVAALDAHHHIWWMDQTPWLHGPMVSRIFGDYGPIRRDYLADEYAADAADYVSGSVHVQVNLPPDQAAWEVRAVAEAGAPHGLIQGVVAQADLRDPHLAEHLDELLAAGPVRGIRQQLHWHPEPRYRFAASATEMLDPAWQAGLSSLRQRDLLFEVQVFPGQMEDMCRVLEQHPHNRFVLLHAGMPVDRSPDGMAHWRARMRDLAGIEGLTVKLSGLGTFVRRCSVEDWAPVVHQTIDLFGPDRCMFGSNFPIEKLWTTYDELVEVMLACLSSFEDDEVRRVMGDVARTVYRIDGHDTDSMSRSTPGPQTDPAPEE